MYAICRSMRESILVFVLKSEERTRPEDSNGYGNIMVYSSVKKRPPVSLASDGGNGEPSRRDRKRRSREDHELFVLRSYI